MPNLAILELNTIPSYLDAGVEYLKIQGREYSVPLIVDIVRFYRDVIDYCLTSPRPIVLSEFRSRLLELLHRRDLERETRTQALLTAAGADAQLPLVGVED